MVQGGLSYIQVNTVLRECGKFRPNMIEKDMPLCSNEMFCYFLGYASEVHREPMGELERQRHGAVFSDFTSK